MEIPASIFRPESPEAAAIAHLFILSFAICGTIFAVVAGLAIYNLIRFRWVSGEPEPAQIHGNKKMEVIWTVVPLLILFVLFALTTRAMKIADPPMTAKPDLLVIGHQWWWEIRYQSSGVVTANEIHIPVGRSFSVQFDSADVLHEFWVPQLTRKMTAVPSAGNHVWMQANRPGTYEGLCSEFCGTEHAWMRFQVIAESPADFEIWQKAQRSTANATAQTAKGQKIFREMTCISCHSIEGISTSGNAGPSLTHLASRHYIGARIVPNTPENLRRWLKDPQRVKPGVLMPNFNLNDEQLDALVAYLESLK